MKVISGILTWLVLLLLILPDLLIRWVCDPAPKWLTELECELLEDVGVI